MVERSADILSINTGEPVKLSKSVRFDMALRRIPGLGILATGALLHCWWPSRNPWTMVLLAALTCAYVVAAALVLLDEFLPHAE